MNSTVPQYKVACSDASYDMYAFTETWLNENTISKQIFGADYVVYRTDRSQETSLKDSGGGVLLAVRSTFSSHRLFPPNCTGVEQVWVTVSLAEKTLFLCVLYLPPDRLNDSALINQHLNSLLWVLSKLNATDEIFVVGDFNLASIRWLRNEKGFYLPDSSYIAPLAASVLDCYNTADLLQLCGVPNDFGNVLDLCFASRDVASKCSVFEAPGPLVKCNRDHRALHVSLRFCPACPFQAVVDTVSYDYRKANFEGMIAFLNNISWDDELHDLNVDDAASTFSNIVVYAIDQFVPKKTPSTPTNPSWSNPRLKRLKTSKRAALKKYCKLRTASSRRKLNLINKRYKRLNHRLYQNHQRQLQNKLKTNPKSFWNHVNDQRKESGLPTTMYKADREEIDVEGIAELFRLQFSSVFVEEHLSNEQIAAAASEVPVRQAVTSHPSISSDDVQKAGLLLKKSFGTGPDGIPSFVIKNCMGALCAPLASIFNLSLHSGVFPKSWKKSYVFPVFKKGDKQSVTNYRGIAALCAVSKLFELLVLDYLKHNCSQYIATEQHGFMSKRSTSTNLVLYTSTIIREMEKGNQVDAIYTDLSAAFDKINHQIAVSKLERLGFHGSLLRWLHSYLIDRHMSVKIGDHVSQPFAVSSGVPQGSHLGPFIFLLYLNDVHFSIRCPKLSYADDFKLYFVIKDRSDALFLQQQLDAFALWCHNNRMVLNASKCAVISFSRKKTSVCFAYQLHGHILSRESSIKDLGVLLDSQLTFNDHVSYISSKASRQLGFIFRFAKNFKDISCLKALYFALVRSTLEYCSVVWAPFYQNAEDRIERIQHRFVRYALRWLPWRNPRQLPDYEDRCQLMSLQLLSVRRDVSMAIFVVDLLRSDIDCVPLLQKLKINIRRVNLRFHYFLYIPMSRTNYGANEPLTKMCSLFNTCYTCFDFNISRVRLKNLFYNVLLPP